MQSGVHTAQNGIINIYEPCPSQNAKWKNNIKLTSSKPDTLTSSKPDVEVDRAGLSIIQVKTFEITIPQHI